MGTGGRRSLRTRAQDGRSRGRSASAASAQVDTVAPPRLETDDPVAERRYAEAAARVVAALRAGDFRWAAALGPWLCLLAPGAALGLARQAVRAGDGGAAVRLLAAHLAEGGTPAALAAPCGGGRLLEEAEALVRAAWGSDPAADRRSAALLAALHRALDPTDSYLLASRWAALAAEDGAAGEAAEDGAAPTAVRVVLAVWRDGFGLACDGGRLLLRPPTRDGALRGVRRPDGSVVDVVVRGHRTVHP